MANHSFSVLLVVFVYFGKWANKTQLYHEPTNLKMLTRTMSKIEKAWDNLIVWTSVNGIIRREINGVWVCTKHFFVWRFSVNISTISNFDGILINSNDLTFAWPEISGLHFSFFRCYLLNFVVCLLSSSNSEAARGNRVSIEVFFCSVKKYVARNFRTQLNFNRPAHKENPFSFSFSCHEKYVNCIKLKISIFLLTQILCIFFQAQFNLTI